MWALRRASNPLKNRVLGIRTSRACCAKSEVASCCLDVKASNGDSCLVASDGCISLKRFYSAAHGSPNFFMGCCSFSSQADTKSSAQEEDDLEDGFSELETAASAADVVQDSNVDDLNEDQLISEPELSEEEDDDDGVEEPQNELELFDTEAEVTEKRPPQKRASSALFKAIMAAPGLSVQSALDKWVEEGNDLNRPEIALAMLNLRKRRMYGRALQLSEWLESTMQLDFVERDYASRLDLISKVRGLQKAENYIEKIPSLTTPLPPAILFLLLKNKFAMKVKVFRPSNSLSLFLSLMATAIAFITTTATTPTKLSTSALSHRGSNSNRSNLLLSLFTNPNFNTKFSSLKTKTLHVNASSTIGAANEALDASSPGLVGANDLLIVGPGVLGRLVAEKWQEDHPGSQIIGQTATTDHHDELIKIGINPSLKGTKAIHKFPYVVFCAPPSRTLDYPGDVREAASSWSGEGSFVFTSSSAPYDCSDNGPCDEDSPSVPIGRNPRTDVLLKAEKVVLEYGGCVLRLAGLYISFMKM